MSEHSANIKKSDHRRNKVDVPPGFITIQPMQRAEVDDENRMPSAATCYWDPNMQQMRVRKFYPTQKFSIKSSTHLEVL